MSILLDAGPSLNFLAVGQQDILIKVAQSRALQIEAPERVDREVLGKTNDPRFARTAVKGTWGKLKSTGRVAILNDDLSATDLAAAVSRVSGMPAEQRVKQRASLGEIMVIAHASVYAQRGVDVYILMDEGDGRRRAKQESCWLAQRGHRPLTLWNTLQVLRDAARSPGWIAGGHTWEDVYDQMCKFDDGLRKR